MSMQVQLVIPLGEGIQLPRNSVSGETTFADKHLGKPPVSV